MGCVLPGKRARFVWLVAQGREQESAIWFE